MLTLQNVIMFVCCFYIIYLSSSGMLEYAPKCRETPHANLHQCFLNLPIFDHRRLTCLLLQILIASFPLLANSAFI